MNQKNRHLQKRNSRKSSPTAHSETLEVKEFYQGALPSPQMLAGFNDQIDNGGNRIMAMAEQLQNYEINANEKLIEVEIELEKKRCDQFSRGQWMAYSLCFVLIAGGLILGGLGNPWFGGTAFFTGLVGVAGAFMKPPAPYRIKKNQKEE